MTLSPLEAELLKALKNMIAVAETDYWEYARTGRQIVFCEAIEAVSRGVLRVRSAAVGTTLCLLIAIASTPTTQHHPDDMSRNPRTLRVRVRHHREDQFATDLLEDIA